MMLSFLSKICRDVESIMKPWGGSEGKLIGLLVHCSEKKTSEASVLRCVSRQDGEIVFEAAHRWLIML
ncbi:hypothetical protein HanRHA438_Chr11g0503171 [Helianthus annuus]|nr:hypothetical protein HanRHA438_Chr11g0503171 [Helianthus annuus]